MLRIVEKWFDSNVGRQRQGNEDNYFVQAPLFVVADGMGGAQAGEVASEMAVDAFRSGLGNGRPEDALVEIIREANRRIHDMSQSDSQRTGMGTTCTAAYVDEDEVVLAHVGDSRAYLFRDGDLTRLTRDHSLVGELVDRGKLTEEQAEMHPQRSVITRALGPEPEVQVDTERIAARAGDVFLLCSDGLTSMIREPGILPIMVEATSLAEAGKKLIAAANAAGGRDNITVILFRLAEIEAAADGREDATTQVGEGAPATRDVAEAVKAAEEAEYRRDATVALSAIKPTAEPTAEQEPEPAEKEPAPAPAPPVPKRTAPLPPEKPKPGKRRRPRWLVPLVAVLVVAAIIGIAGWIATRAVFFIDVGDSGAVTIYRGLPYELPFGVDLYSTHFTSGVTLSQVPPRRRETFTDRKLRSLDDASDLVRQLEQGKLD